MLAVLAVIAFAVAFFEHGAGASHVPVWFNTEGMTLLGLLLLALAAGWPVISGWRRQ